MSEIKTPVRYYQMRNLLWTLAQANNAPIHYEGTEEHAKQIALALNCHDELVGALKALTDESGKFYGWENGYGESLDDKLNAALARAETASETK